MKTKKLNYRVEKKHIGYIRYIFEASDGIGMVSTLNPQDGLICIRIAPGCETDVRDVILGLSEEIRMEVVD